MEKRIKKIKSLILMCATLCTLFVAFISYQSWGTVEYVSENIPNDMANIQWLRLTLIAVRYMLAIGLVATLIAFLTNIWRGASYGRPLVKCHDCNLLSIFACRRQRRNNNLPGNEKARNIHQRIYANHMFCAAGICKAVFNSSGCE